MPSPPSTRKTRHTQTAKCHSIGAHANPSHEPRLHYTLVTLHTTHSTRGKVLPEQAAPLTRSLPRHVPPSTHQPSSCSCEAAPFPYHANKRLLLPALLKKGRLSRSGRAGRPQQAAQHCSLVPPGGPGRGRPLCAAHLCSVSPQYPPHLLFIPSCHLRPGLSTSLPLLGLPLFPPASQFSPSRCSEAPSSSSATSSTYGPHP